MTYLVVRLHSIIIMKFSLPVLVVFIVCLFSCRTSHVTSYNPLSTDSLALMEESVNSYSILNNKQLDKESARFLLNKIQDILINKELSRLTNSNEIDTTIFTIANGIVQDYFSKNGEAIVNDYFATSDSILLTSFLSELVNRSILNQEEFANNEQPYNGGDVVVEGRPNRQLQYLIKHESYYLIFYKHGGFLGGDSHLALFDLVNPRILSSSCLA